MSLFFQNRASLFSQPYTSLFDRLNIRERQGEAGNRFLQGNPSIEDLRLLGYTQYCGSTSDCGYGSQCVDGLCRPIGAGNTQYGEGGCSSGPSSNPPATLDCINCGYDSEKSCAGTRTCRFTPFGVTCKCGQSTDTNTGDPEGEEGKPCNKYCTTEYSSYGTYGPGCSDRNTCSECYSCDGGDDDNGNCTKKSRDDGAPCHCDPNPDESCTPRDEVPITCCSYQDTCFGRIDQAYCHETYRPFYSRCYNPDYPYCNGPFYPDDPECLACERAWVSWNQNQTEPVIPDDDSRPCYNEAGDSVCDVAEVLCTDPITGQCTCRECCPQFGGSNEIINEETGDTKTFLECCKPTCQGDPFKCESSYDCGAGLCCAGNGECVPCEPTTTCDRLSPIVTASFDGASFVKSGLCECYDIRVRSTGFINGARYFRGPWTGDAECSGCDDPWCFVCNCPYRSELDIVTPWYKFDQNLLAVAVGRKMFYASSNYNEVQWGNYYDIKQCGEPRRYMARNGILGTWNWRIVNNKFEVYYQEYSLWGGNVDALESQYIEFEVNFEIEVRPGTSASPYCQGTPLPVPTNIKF